MKKSVNKIYAITAIISCMFLVIFSQDCMNAALNGFDIWLCFVMPSVFPFFVCISFMRESGILQSNGKSFTLPLFISCALSGAPSGSRLCAYLADNGGIERNKLSSYCAICNMVSPAFITGTLVSMSGSIRTVLPMLIGHYGASFIMLCFINRNNRCGMSLPHQETKRSFFDLLCSSISDGIKTCVQICGVIVFFTVFLAAVLKISYLFGIDTWNPLYVFLISLIEMTNGSGMIFSIGLSFPIMCALLCFAVSFGGICIMAQAAQIAPIQPKKYLTTKLVTATIAGMLAFIAAIVIPFEQTVFSNAGEMLGQAVEGGVSLGVIALSSLIGCAFVWLIGVKHSKHIKSE